MSLFVNHPRPTDPVLRTPIGDPICLRSSKLKALKGRPIIAQGKRVRERRPGYAGPVNLPLTAMSRDSAELICGILNWNRRGGRQ
jgi:hypothetical protein